MRGIAGASGVHDQKESGIPVASPSHGDLGRCYQPTPLATAPGREGTRPGAVVRRIYEEVRVRGMRWPERLAAIAPASRSTRPATATAPIPNAVHEKPPATVASFGAAAAVFLCPRPYFLFSASLRSFSARYSAPVMPTRTRL